MTPPREGGGISYWVFEVIATLVILGFLVAVAVVAVG